jgi:hypothetical protein
VDSSVSVQGPVAGCCEHGNEPSGSIKGRYCVNADFSKRTPLHGGR